MDIEWELRVLAGGKVGTLAKIEAPSKIRQLAKIANLGRSIRETHVTTALYQQDEDNTYRVAFIPAIRQHFDLPTKPLNTEKGARRRIRKYVELWAIAGYPTGGK